MKVVLRSTWGTMTLPDHDFVLRIPLAGKPVEVTAWCARDANGAKCCWPTGCRGCQIPLRHQKSHPCPREFIFVLDRSGSMSGEPIRQARNALRACLRILDAQDIFRILLFDDYLEWYQKEAAAVTQAAIDQADSLFEWGRRPRRHGNPPGAGFRSQPAGETGSYPLHSFSDRWGRFGRGARPELSFARNSNQARVFTFGIGPSVNRALLSRMAQLGRGAAEFLQLDEDIEGAILRFQDRVAFPVLTDIHIEWVHCKAWDIYPALAARSVCRSNAANGRPDSNETRARRQPCCA